MGELIMSGKRSLIYGVGINDWEDSCSFTNNKGKKELTKEYKLWRAMITRCYSDYTKSVRPTYIGVTCDDSWLSMTKFIEDVSKLKGYDKSFTSGWVLDKDILSKGCKHYSIETCCFVPSEINGCLTVRTLHRGELPLGVTLDIKTGLFKARCGYNGTRRSLGLFETKEEAFGAYLLCKKKELKRLADKHKEFIDSRVYSALINYEFTLED